MSDVKNNSNLAPNNIVIVNQNRNQSNGLGTAGFILSLLALILCWVPIINIILWILFSFIGIFKKPRGLAIAGIMISCILLFIGLIFLNAIISGLST